jgi:signal transduction histidine kinase/ActR/RegA family two-component response regulator
MKVQTKILLLLLAVVAVFIAGILYLRARETARFLRIAEERAWDREHFFDGFLARQGEPLEMLAKDYTYWDDMVRAVDESDRAWLNANLNNDGTWQSSNADALWVYRPERTLLYSANRLDVENDLRDIPLPDAAFDRLDHERLMHFFVATSQGIMEIRAATIHPSVDSYRRTNPRGFFFAGRLWSNETVRAFSRDSDNEVRLLPPTAAGAAGAGNPTQGIVLFTRDLNGWNDRPIARLLVRNRSETIRDLIESSHQLLALLVGFAIVLLVSSAILLEYWVSRPLRLISQTLKTEHLGPVAKLRGDGSEFGGVAKLIEEFFGQRESLLAEIVERKSAQEALRQSADQLRQAQKMEAVGRLAGGVAHDFNNLLTAILGYAELIIHRHDLDPITHQNVEMIQKAGRQAAAVTHQLLAFSRKQVLQPRIIDLNALAVDFQKILRRVIGELIELDVQARAECGRVRADPNQIEQVILNLGVNARDAMMPRGGRLTIRTTDITLDAGAARRLSTEMAAGPYVLMEVSDTGMGMDEEVKSKIFEPFFTTKGPGKGTGLGLATVYGIVKQSGGTVAVDSTPGAGSTFRIYLPREAGAVEDPRPKTVSPLFKSTRKAETLLIVEDEEVVRQLVCQVLSDQGYEVLCASHGGEALRMSAEFAGRIALLVTDVVMPQMGGLELARRLLAERPAMKVLYVSGYSESDMSEQGILSADLEFLEKPFTPHAISRKVKELLNPAQAARDAVGAPEKHAWEPVDGTMPVG